MQVAPPLLEKTFTSCCAQFTSDSQMLSSGNLDAIVFLHYMRVWRCNFAGIFDANNVDFSSRGAQNGVQRCYATGLDQPSPATIPVPSFTTISWSAATPFSSSWAPLGQRIAMSAVFSAPRPKWSLLSFTE
jgi:hypothetical protein